MFHAAMKTRMEAHRKDSKPVTTADYIALEDEFGIEIPDEDAEKINTVQNAIDYALAHKKA